MTKFELMFFDGGCMNAIKAISTAAGSWSGASRDAHLHEAIVDTMVSVIVCKCHVYDYLFHTGDYTPEELSKAYDDVTAIVSALRYYEDTTHHAHRVIPCLDDNDQPRTDFDWT